MTISQDDLANRFIYHAPHGNQAERYECIRLRAFDLAEYICEVTPSSREQSLALTKLEEAVFWSNAAIARNEVTIPQSEIDAAVGTNADLDDTDENAT